MPFRVITAALEFVDPFGFDTRTQKLVMLVIGGVTNTAAVAPGTGFVTTPEAPRYHWYVIGAVPIACTLICSVWPAKILPPRGWTVIVGAVAVPAHESVENVASAPVAAVPLALPTAR